MLFYTNNPNKQRKKFQTWIWMVDVNSEIRLCLAISSLHRIQILSRSAFLDQSGHFLRRLRNAGYKFLKQLVLFGSELLNDFW